MNLVKSLKKNSPRIPYSIGKHLAKVPWGSRPLLGRIYTLRERQIAELETVSIDFRKDFIFQRVRKVTEHAFKQVPFYKQHYQKFDFHPDQLKGFDCIQKIPIITKQDLVAFEIEQRSYSDKGTSRMLANTGGSSGTPLSFYIQTDSYGHEKSHMNHVWSKLGFRQSDSILTFSGRSKAKHAIQYDGLRHAFMVDIYQPFERLAEAIGQLIRRNRMPRFLHGYPSAIYDFLAQVERERSGLAEQLRDIVDGTFFGSEFPNPVWRQKIESITGASSVSWYGHTERCVLAYEAGEQYQYVPFPTYGYAETTDSESGEQLVGTSFYNFASPFIRYNTEDGISTYSADEGLLQAFSIVDGRNGEFVTDKNGKKIPLTGLIFGRHHRLFDYCRSLQVSQSEIGKSAIYYSVLPGVELPSEASQLFDSSNVAMEFEFVRCDSPIRTAAGKVGLLIKEPWPKRF